MPDREPTEVRWFPLSELPGKRDDYSNIRVYGEYLVGGIELPLFG